MPEQDSRTFDERRRDGKIVGEAYAELVERIENAADDIDFAEWKYLIGIWMQRPDTVQGFHDLVDYSKMSGFNPSESNEFKRAFIKYVAVDLKVMFLDKLRDPIAYLAFMTAIRKPTAMHRVDPLEVLGLK